MALLKLELGEMFFNVFIYPHIIHKTSKLIEMDAIKEEEIYGFPRSSFHFDIIKIQITFYNNKRFGQPTYDVPIP